MDWVFLIFLLLFFFMSVQPVLALRRLRALRHAKINEIEQELGARIITLIHRQERPDIFGRRSSRYIDIEDAESVIQAIQTTPKSQPIALIMHTPGGLVLAATQIARALHSHPARVTVYVPSLALSGGTLVALAADHIVMDEFAIMGPIDPQVLGLPAASVVNVKALKEVSDIHDLTLIVADIGEKAMAQVSATAATLLSDRLGPERAQALADHLSRGTWTHDHPITPDDVKSFGLSVSVDVPGCVKELMELYPQPVRQLESVESSPPQDARLLDFTRRVWGEWVK